MHDWYGLNNSLYIPFHEELLSKHKW